jgi:hypothetical protein
MRVWGRHCLTWRGRKLCRLGDRKATAAIEPDQKYPTMWRFRLLPDGNQSDMVNLPRAKDAAVAVVLAILNRQRVGKESGAGRPRIGETRSPVPNSLPQQNAPYGDGRAA